MTPPSPRPWLKSYSEGVPADIKVDQYTSLVQLMEDSFRQYADRPAYSFMGKSFSYSADRQRVHRICHLFAGFGFGQR
jgi:long-chain acyl-CoA synthetase